MQYSYKLDLPNATHVIIYFRFIGRYDLFRFRWRCALPEANTFEWILIQTTRDKYIFIYLLFFAHSNTTFFN